MALAFEQVAILGFDPTPIGSHRALFPAASEVGLLMKGATGQTADLLQLQDSLGTSLAKINALGHVRLGNAPVLTGVEYPVAADQVLNLFKTENSFLVIQHQGLGNPSLKIISDPAHGGRHFSITARINENSIGGGKFEISDSSVFDDVPAGGGLQAARFVLDQLGHFGLNSFNPQAIVDIGGVAKGGVWGTTYGAGEAGVAFGVRLQGSLVATGNNDILRGMYLVPGFQDAGFTGVIHRTLEVVGNVLLGTASDAMGFYGVTPVARQLLATGAGRTVDDVIAALQALGLVRQS